MKKTARRKFLKAMALASGASVYAPKLAAYTPTLNDRYATLDEVLKKPVLRTDLLPDPVVIDSLELLQDRNSFICRVRSKDGAEGVSIGHPSSLRPATRCSPITFSNTLCKRTPGS